MNTDAKTLAYINMYAILGRIPDLCRLSKEAAALLPSPPLRLCLDVKDGPAMTLRLGGGQCAAEPLAGDCDIRLPFSTCQKFNGLLDGTTTPFPSKGFTKIKFLTGNFTKLTDILSRYLQASEADLADVAFFAASTELMLYVVANALVQVANHDKIGRFTASNMVDGTIVLGIKDGPAAAVEVKNHTLQALPAAPEHPTAIMQFASRLARGLFEGSVSALACIGTGQIETRGNMSLLDNVNRLLDRVALYLG